MTLTSLDIATAFVDTEEQKARAQRIKFHQDEIDRVLRRIEEVKKKGEKALTWSSEIFSGTSDEAERIRSALLQLGYTCTKVEPRQGAWENGSGYQRLIAFDVSW